MSQLDEVQNILVEQNERIINKLNEKYAGNVVISINDGLYCDNDMYLFKVMKVKTNNHELECKIGYFDEIETIDGIVAKALEYINNNN